MKKILIVVGIIIILIIVFLGIVELLYNGITQGVECCSCCGDSEEICISACCGCNYNIFEKIKFIFNN